MSDSILVRDQQACFRFKTSFTPCTIMQLTRYDLEDLNEQTAKAVAKAPNFFIGSPVVLDLELIKNSGRLNFKSIKQILINNNLVPVGVRGGSQDQLEEAATAGFPLITIGKPKLVESEDPVETVQPEEPVRIQPNNHKAPATKVVTSPVRSGMQVYAKETDLIIMSSVGAGAEILADGNIHVYGPLRGRALAGVQGNIHARIFCRTLEAELVAIAGYYLVKEDIKDLPSEGSMIQVYLEDEEVKIAAV
jgi:septum site-determining protein MinC